MSRFERLAHPRSLSRRVATKAAKAKIIIYCEGGTEQDYLEKLRVDVGTRLVDVEAIGEVGVPNTVVNAAIRRYEELSQKARKKGSDSFDNRFAVWAMFDRDEHEVDEAKKRAVHAGVKLAYSNPCFELWAILHFEDGNAPSSSHEAQRKLHSLMPTYHHKNNPYFDYKDMGQDARSEALSRARSLKIRREQEDACEGNPYTSVCDLVDDILVSAGTMPSVRDALRDIDLEIANIKSGEEKFSSEAQANLNRLYNMRRQLSSR